jgi:2,3-bisphosphoglycerate-independent phosphoglycerate mutase
VKYIVILGDGMADWAIPELNGKTPLMTARTPHIDQLCAKGRTGRLSTIPADMPPASDVANLGVLGYDVHDIYEGRGVLEAASMGVKLEPQDLALRCNLICIEDNNIKNHSAGHISSEEAGQLIDSLNHELGNDSIKFYPGVSYRNLLVVKGGNKNISCTPPHDVPGTPFNEVMIKPLNQEGNETANLLNNLSSDSQNILQHHPVNIERVKNGKDPANLLWFWSPGYKPSMKTFKELYHIHSGAVISAVDLIQGIGHYAGFKIIKVKGATGLYDTNYEGKAEATIKALNTADFVYLHIEASDEAGHEGDVDLKIKTIEYLDYRVVKYIIEESQKFHDDVAIAILPDHPTPCEIKTHSREPVPFIIYRPGETPDHVLQYNEESVKDGYFGILQGNQFMKKFLKVS